MTTILNPPKIETDPVVIRRTSRPGEAYNSETMRVDGKFARVSIKTAADWNFIRMMQHGVDYHAPASGDGLLVRVNLLIR